MFHLRSNFASGRICLLERWQLLESLHKTSRCLWPGTLYIRYWKVEFSKQPQLLLTVGFSDICTQIKINISQIRCQKLIASKCNSDQPSISNSCFNIALAAANKTRYRRAQRFSIVLCSPNQLIFLRAFLFAFVELGREQA